MIRPLAALFESLGHTVVRVGSDMRCLEVLHVGAEESVRFEVGAQALGDSADAELRRVVEGVLARTETRKLRLAVRGELRTLHVVPAEQEGVWLAIEACVHRAETRELVDRMHVGVVIHGSDAEIVIANPTSLELLGLSEEQLLGRTSHDERWRCVREDGSPFPGEDHPSVRALRTARPVRDVPMGVFRPEHDDWVWLSVSAVPQLAEDGSVRQVVASFTDITELRTALDTLHREHQTLRGVLDNDLFATVVFDAAGIAHFANDAAVRLLGITVTARGRLDIPEWEMFDEKRRPLGQAERPFARLMASPTGRLSDLRVWIRVDDGPMRHFSVSAAMVLDARGRPDRLVFVAVDLTDQVERDRSLRESEERLELALEGATLGLWDCRPQEDSLHQDPAFWERVMGYQDPSALPTSAMDSLQWIHPADRQRCVESMEAHVRGETDAYRSEHRMRAADGTWVWLQVSGRVTERDTEGKPLRITGTYYDLREQKRAEEQRLRVQAQMENISRYESLSVLAGGIAHDFNNLLVGMLSSSSLALELLPAGSPARGSVELVEVAAQRAADLTRQLLAYSGKGRFVVEPVDLHALVSDMSDLLAAMITRRISVHLEMGPEDARINADPTQIRQVVMNLCLNAAEAIGDRQGEVWVRTGVRELTEAGLHERVMGSESVVPGTYAFVEVQDNGSGMPTEVLNRIFDPFYTTKAAGHGLGLAAVLGVVRGHAGFVQVRSEPGEGTRFLLAFPALVGLSRSPVVIEEVEPEPVPMGRVLVIDDEEVVRAVTSSVLVREGCEVVTAQDGVEGLEVLEASPDRYTGVVLDLTMPRMSGGEVLRRIRTMDPDMPVLLISGYTEDDAAELLGGGVAPTAFLQKPFTARELAAIAKTLFSEPGTRAVG